MLVATTLLAALEQDKGELPTKIEETVDQAKLVAYCSQTKEG